MFVHHPTFTHSPRLQPSCSSISISLPLRTPAVSCRRPMRSRMRRRKDTASVCTPPYIHSFTPSPALMLLNLHQPAVQNAGGVLQAAYALAHETPEGYCRCSFANLTIRILVLPRVHNKRKHPSLHMNAFFCCLPGSYLLSRKVALRVPSAWEGLTAVFGMGTGGSLPLSPPDYSRMWSPTP